MTTVTITASIALTLEGQSFSTGGTFTADVARVVEQTSDLDTTYRQLQSGTVTGCSFIFLVNLGDEPALVSFGGATFGLPAGKHILLSGTAGQTVSNVTTLSTNATSELSARSVTGTTRVYSVVGF